MGGGEMIESVHQDSITYGVTPHKFEPARRRSYRAIGLGAALDYMLQVGRERIARHEAELRDTRTRACASSTGSNLRTARGKARSCPSHRRPATRTTSPPSSTARAWQCARAITARNR